MTHYDKIAEAYAGSSEERISKRYIFTPSFFTLIGNLKDKEVLDLACGDGYITRKIKERGAKRVIGVDISKEMIRLAREKEKSRELGINYIVSNVANLEKLGDFDIVAGTFLLHYSKSRAELSFMCKNIYKNLKKGGRFIGINQNPDCPHTTHKEYSSVIQPIGRLREGGKIKVTLYNGDRESCSFENYHWEKSTYEKALKNAGFNRIRWVLPQVSQEGIDRFGKDFWNGQYKEPTVALIEARK